MPFWSDIAQLGCKGKSCGFPLLSGAWSASACVTTGIGWQMMEMGTGCLAQGWDLGWVSAEEETGISQRSWSCQPSILEGGDCDPQPSVCQARMLWQHLQGRESGDELWQVGRVGGAAYGCGVSREKAILGPGYSLLSI